MIRKSVFLVLLLVALLSSAGVSMAQNVASCPGALNPRLVAGEQARVTPGLPNVVRAQPYRGSASPVLGEIPAGAVFTVLAGYGPQCGNSMLWYYVSYNGIVGWTPEGDGSAYWLEPIATSSCTTLPPRLTFPGHGRVTPGLPNVLRSQPFRGPGSAIIGLIPAGGQFTVQSNPSCGSGYNWWLVNYNGVTGWTAEGQGSTYWIEPVGTGIPMDGCHAQPNPHMTVNASGFVQSGEGIPIYDQSTSASAIIGHVPGGGWLRVLTPPVCSESVNWYQVNYNGLVGWVIEAQNANYNINPFACENFMPSRLVPGGTARVLPGTPNNLRNNPSLSAGLLGQIPGGQTVTIIGGPVCGNNGAWWGVSYGTISGWTLEGQNGTYWLAP